MADRLLSVDSVSLLPKPDVLDALIVETSAGAPVQSVAGQTGAVTVDLDDLADVTITSPQNSEVLKFNGTIWTNAADGGSGGGGGGDVASVNGATGTVVLDADDISDTSTTNKFTNAAAISKLAGIAAGATVNAADATLLGRGNHTGQQTASTISDFNAAASAAAPVQTVAGRTGTVVVTATDVGLGNVTNTSDTAKPVSTAQQTALDLKANAAITVTAGTGLTGGGNLTASRTLAANIGTTAGTVAAGDDSRMTNARTPTGAAGGDLAGTYPNPTVANVMHLTGAETAGGVKTFSSPPVVPDASFGIAKTSGLQTALDLKATTADLVTAQDDISDLDNRVDDLETGKLDVNVRIWTGTAGTGTWGARPSVPAGFPVTAYSVLDIDAPPPPDAVAGDLWNTHPDAT